MRSVAVMLATAGQACPLRYPHQIQLGGAALACGLAETHPPRFAPEAEHRSALLLRVLALSCNYRDRALMAMCRRRAAANAYYVIGSEFVAEVLQVGDDVKDFSPGDRVIPDNHFIGYAPPSAGRRRQGIPTNHGSREQHVLDASYVIRIPESMAASEAAGFSIGAQTAYSMLRKIAVAAGDSVLVTAGRSNTSLFAIQALARRGCDVTVATSGEEARAGLMALGATSVAVVARAASTTERFAALAPEAGRVGGFHAVVDPFYDLNMNIAVDLLRPSGRYVTCGRHRQGDDLVDDGPPRMEPDVVLKAIANNLQIIGNNLGTRADLSRAIEDSQEGRFRTVVDSEFGEREVGPFLDRTFNDSSRFGKVVLHYGAPSPRPAVQRREASSKRRT